jgi:hypothetical protein
MNKKIALSVFATALLGAANVQGAEDLSTMFSEGKTSGQIRMFHINRDDNTKKDRQIATAIGGHLKFETAAYEGLNFGAAFYTTNRIFSGLEKDVMGPNASLLANDGSSYSILGEAYVQYAISNTVLKGGRQKLDTPLAGSDDARMLPNLFEAYLLINKDIPDTTLIAGHVTKFAPGTFANQYAGGILGVTSGYTAVAANNAAYQGEFTNMGTWAIDKKTDGVSVVSATYTGVENLKLQLWDYYAHDILNAVYGEANFSWKCLVTDAIKPSLSAQFIKEDDVGDSLAGKVSSLYWGAKFDAKVSDFTLSLAYSQQSKADSAAENLKKSTISPWGGMPAYTQGMVTRHQFIAGTDAAKVAANYNFKNVGANVNLTGYYAEYDMDDNSGLGTARTASEAGFDAIYSPEAVKNLQLRLRGNFPRDYTNGRDWDEYRLIANYNF